MLPMSSVAIYSLRKLPSNARLCCALAVRTFYVISPAVRNILVTALRPTQTELLACAACSCQSARRVASPRCCSHREPSTSRSIRATVAPTWAPPRGGLREYQFTLDLAQRVRARLEASSVSVRLTREDDLPLTRAAPAWRDRGRSKPSRRRASPRACPRGSTSRSTSTAAPPSLRGTETYYNPDARRPATDDRPLADALQQQRRRPRSRGRLRLVDRGVKSDLLAGQAVRPFLLAARPGAERARRAPVPVERQRRRAAARRRHARRARRRRAQGILEYLAGGWRRATESAPGSACAGRAPPASPR